MPSDTNNFPLSDCPGSPNCVCTVASRSEQSMPAIPYECSSEQAMQKIVNCLSEIPLVTILSHTESYLHATARTRWLRFVDDVEFFVDDEAKLIHFRSASRLGYSDLGANRRRMEQITQRLKGSL